VVPSPTNPSRLQWTGYCTLPDASLCVMTAVLLGYHLAL
jgi:hypothetical protein